MMDPGFDPDYATKYLRPVEKESHPTPLMRLLYNLRDTTGQNKPVYNSTTMLSQSPPPPPPPRPPCTPRQLDNNETRVQNYKAIQEAFNALEELIDFNQDLVDYPETWKTQLQQLKNRLNMSKVTAATRLPHLLRQSKNL